MPKTAVSLFTGCGGSDAGLTRAGFDVLMANDILPYAKEVYLQNLDPTDYIVKSVSEIRHFPNVDLLSGCYPCQGFSQGGARVMECNLNYLYRDFDRALRKIRPKAFIVENVPGMRRSDNEKLLNNQMVRFRMAGYRVKIDILNARDFGVAQNRRRIFIVGIRSDIDTEYHFPKPMHGPGANRPYVTVREAIGDMELWPEGEYNDQEFHWYYMSRNRRVDWDETAKTMVSNMRHMTLHPVSPQMEKVGPDKWRFISDAPARRFSYNESARLQGFSNKWILPDSVGMSMKYKVVGNAVPPPLFQAVAEALPDIW